MKKIMKKVLCIAAIYLVAIVVTFLVTERVEKLEGNKDLRNTNSSVALK